MKQSFFSHGKLLLTAEYLVLDGTKALALPTKKGQQMEVELLPGSGNIHWVAKDLNGHIWLNCSFILQDEHLIPIAMGTLVTSPEVQDLMRILENALQLNPIFINNQTDYEINTQLQFSNEWGLGSSSTLIANIAQWAGVDALELFFRSWAGSGYDVAVAMESNPIIYRLEGKKPIWEPVNFNPSFARDIYFVYSGNKQSSRDEIVNYKSNAKPTAEQMDRISELTTQILNSKELFEFENLLEEHESILSNILKTPPIKQRLFGDYPGAVKSLGAWGGDFMLATGKGATTYFPERGYNTVLTFEELIKS